MNLFSYLFAFRRHRCNKKDKEESMANINTWVRDKHKNKQKKKTDPSVLKRTSLG